MRVSGFKEHDAPAFSETQTSPPRAGYLRADVLRQDEATAEISFRAVRPLPLPQRALEKLHLFVRARDTHGHKYAPKTPELRSGDIEVLGTVTQVVLVKVAVRNSSATLKVVSGTPSMPKMKIWPPVPECASARVRNWHCSIMTSRSLLTKPVRAPRRHAIVCFPFRTGSIAAARR